jgi:hypothetical protein
LIIAITVTLHRESCLRWSPASNDGKILRLLVVVVPRNLEVGAESNVAEIDKVNREEIRNKRMKDWNLKSILEAHIMI